MLQVHDMFGSNVSESLPVKWDGINGFHVAKLSKVRVQSKSEIMKAFCRGKYYVELHAKFVSVFFKKLHLKQQ